jgi:hypothetical protein
MSYSQIAKKEKRPMSDRRKVYNKLHQTLKKQMKNVPQNHVVVLSMMITGIVFSKKSHLSAISSEIPHQAKDSSIEQRFRRFNKNDHVNVRSYFLPFAQQIIQNLGNRRLTIAMDGSTIGRGCMTLMVGVVYRRRVLPLTWLLYEGKKGHASASKHIEALKELQAILCPESDVLLVGDGEYNSVDLLTWIETNTFWNYVLRASKSSLIQDGEEKKPLSSLDTVNYEYEGIMETFYTQKGFGPINAVGFREDGYEDSIYLLTRLEDLEAAIKYYKQRPLIETLFSDQKSRGFGIDKSHISDASRLNRLFLGVVLAYIWMVYLGMDVIFAKEWGLIDKQTRRDKSVFRLGMDWFKYLLKHGFPLPISFSVQQEQDLIPSSPNQWAYIESVGW